MSETKGTSEAVQDAPGSQPVPARRALVMVDNRRQGGRKADAMLDMLEEGGLTLVRHEWDRHGRLSGAITSLRREVDCVVLAGGDRTLAAAAIALRDTGLPLGILPLGRRNELARTLGILDTPDGAAGVILAGHTRAIDVASVNGHPFFNAASIGLTPDITRQLRRAASGPLSGPRFGLKALRVALAHRRFSAVVHHGTTTQRMRAMQIIVGIDRTAQHGDGLLDVYSIEPDTRWHLMVMADAFAPAERREPGQPDGLRTSRGSVIEIVTREPRSIMADGEIVTTTPARFGILPAAVTVYAPPAADGA